MTGKTGLTGGKAVMKYFFGSKLARGEICCSSNKYMGKWMVHCFSYTYIFMYLQTFTLLGMPHTNQQIILLTFLLLKGFKMEPTNCFITRNGFTLTTVNHWHE